jgi:FKBP-type peptidyl-prolyl cis-trans isomerase
MKRTCLIVVACLAAPLLGAACSGGTSPSGSGSGTAPAAGPIPAVSGATDLHAAPRIGADHSASPTKLLTRNLVVGTGATASAGSTVVVQYVGANYTNGQVFDSSWRRGQSATFSLAQVIPGFAQGIEGMKVGGRREIVIPSSLGYGVAGAPGGVGPNETLVFVVDLLGIQ